ncbi:MAG: hypothetical protein QM811_07115 [Pirellulales bacterium]
MNEHKTDEYVDEKIVCIGPLAQKILKPHLDRYPTGYIFRPADAVEERTALRRKRKAGRPKSGKARRTNDRYTAHSYFNAIKNGFRLMAQANGHKFASGRVKITKEMAEAAGVQWWHPHQLRHTRGTMTRRKFGSEASAAQLGHGLKVNEIYADRSLELAMRVAQETG